MLAAFKLFKVLPTECLAANTGVPVSQDQRKRPGENGDRGGRGLKEHPHQR